MASETYSGQGVVPPSTVGAGWAITSNYHGVGEVDFWSTVNASAGNNQGFYWHQKTGPSNEVNLAALYGTADAVQYDVSAGDVVGYLGAYQSAGYVGTRGAYPFEIYSNDTLCVSFDTDQRATFENLIRIMAQAVASLPAAGTLGRIACVNDSNSVTWGATVAGGGTNEVLVFDNGTNWTIFAV